MASTSAGGPLGFLVPAAPSQLPLRHLAAPSAGSAGVRPARERRPARHGVLQALSVPKLLVAAAVVIPGLRAAARRRAAAQCNVLTRKATLTPSAPSPAVGLDLDSILRVDVSDFGPEEALRKHVGGPGDAPEVEIIRLGEEGVFAARGTMKVAVPANELYRRLTDPQENLRIFSSNCVALNFRNLIEEDKKRCTRLFEVSKTGQWRIIGIPLQFESTVYAEEDWRNLEIRFRLKKPGAMKHFAGFWRLVPIDSNETLVIFYNEAMTAIPLPALFYKFCAPFVRAMCASLLEDLRKSVASFDKVPVPEIPHAQADTWLQEGVAAALRNRQTA